MLIGVQLGFPTWDCIQVLMNFVQIYAQERIKLIVEAIFLFFLHYSSYNTFYIMLCEAYTITNSIRRHWNLSRTHSRDFLHKETKDFGSVGAQCMCNVLVRYSIIKKVRHLTTWDIDCMLIAGKSLYSTLGFRSQ